MSTQVNLTITAQSSYFGSLDSTWMAPSLADLVFSDCTAVTEYYGDYIDLINKNDTGVDFTGDLRKLANFANALVPSGWEPPDNILHLPLWYFYIRRGDNLNANEEYNAFRNNFDRSLGDKDKCQPQLCDKLDIKGDPDVSGPGVSGSSQYHSRLSLAQDRY